MNKTRRNVVEAAVVAGLVLVVLLAVMLAGGGDESAAPTTTVAEVTSGVFAPPETLGSTGPEAALAGVEAIDCRPLLTHEEVSAALGVEDRPDSSGAFELAQGEACVEPLVDDDEYFVAIQPGNPEDFSPGATQIGVTGERVTGVGDAALWFGGDASESGGAVGILSVAQETSSGLLLYRITLGRPDLDSAAQLEIAKSLALNALPRFPGMEGTAPVRPLVDLCELVTDEEAEGVLADYRDFHPATLDELLVTTNFSGLVDLSQPGDVTCTKLILAEIYVQLQQASAADFEAGASLGGVVGEPLSEIGEEASWFAHVPFSGPFSAPHEQGVLTIRQGEAFFRIVLALPDTDFDLQRDIATGLALSAVQRIPGFEGSISAGSGFAALPEEEEVDRSDFSFVDNLLVKEEAGEWSLGEGLVATLQLFAGEADAADVLRHSEVAVKEGTGILAMASEYLDGGPDPEASAEIARLLDLLVFTNEELEAMAGIEPTAARASVSPAIWGGLSGLVRQAALLSAPSFAHLAALQPVENCLDFYHGNYDPPPGVGPCLEWREVDLPADLKGKYRIFIPAFLQDGWTEEHYKLALDALERSAKWFEGEGAQAAKAAGAPGKMPPVNVVFSLSGSDLASASPAAGRPCGVSLHVPLQKVMEDKPGHAAQTIAHELAHCFQEENFPAQNSVPYRIVRWREEGLAEYLSHLVYPDVDFEWTVVSENDSIKPTTTVMDVAYGNFLFFQHLETEIGLQGIFRLIRSLPAGGGRRQQEERLAAFPNMKLMFHRYGEGMIDGTIVDHGAKLVPYRKEYDTTAITGPASASFEIKPFGLARRRHTVEECEIAHYNNDWGKAKDSARPEAEEAWEEFPTRIPLSRADAHDRIYVATAIEESKVTLEVTDLKDDPECEEAPGGGTACLEDLLGCDPSGYYWVPELVIIEFEVPDS